MRLPRRLAASRDQEDRGAALYGGRRVSGSGSGPVRKGDVRATEMLIEYKRTDGKQITIRLADLEKVRREALARGRTQLLGIEIGGRDYVLREAADDASREELVGELRAEIELLEGRLRDRPGDDPALPGGVAATA